MSKAVTEDQKRRAVLRAKAWNAANKERVREIGRVYYEANKAAYADRQRRYLSETPGRFAARCAARKAAQKQRTPLWADVAMVSAFYAEARRLTEITGIPHEVDHVIPIRGRYVSGLHVETNLQILPRSANRRKSAKHQ